MKKSFLSFSKRTLIIISMVVFSLSIFYLAFGKQKIGAKSILNYSYKTSNDSEEQLNQDIFVTLLDPYIQKSIDNYYGKYLSSMPYTDPWFIKVLSAKRVGDDKSFEFLIKIEALPYLGPHIVVGIDHITFRLYATGEVQMESFEHIESKKLPPNYQFIIKRWPPQ